MKAEECYVCWNDMSEKDKAEFFKGEPFKLKGK